MRNVLTGFPNLYTNEEARAHWIFNAAAGADETDQTSNGNDLTDVNTVGAAARLNGAFSATAQGSRVFDGSADHFTAAGGTNAGAGHRGEWTLEMLVQPDQVSASAVIYYYGGDPASSVEIENILLRVLIDSSGQVATRWEYSSGTQVNTTSTATISADVPTYIALVKKNAASGTSGLYDLFLRIWEWDGTYTEETLGTDLTNATGGANADWYIGKNGSSGSTYFDGYIDEILFSEFPKTDDALRDSFKRLRITWDQSGLYALNQYDTALRVLVEDGSGDWVDLTAFHGYSFVQGATWGEDIDEDMSTANVLLTRDIYGHALSPLMGAGAILHDVLGIARKIKIETAILPLDYGDVPAWAWDVAFEGTIGNIHFGEDPIRVYCRDRMAALEDNYITSGLLTGAARGSPGGTAVETEMQSMLNDYEPSNVNASYGTYLGESGPPQLYTPTSPSWNIKQWNQENMSTAEALVRLADMIGWCLRYRYDENRATHRLTFHEPERSSPSVGYTFGPEDYATIPAASIDLKGIRNFCQVFYGASAGTDNNLGDWERASVTAVDLTSIGNYDFRPCEISEAVNSPVDTATEAQALADAVVADLKDPKAFLTANTTYRHFVQLQDYYTFSANGVHFDSDQSLAVTGYTHTANDQGISTSLQLRGKPSSRFKRFKAMIAKPGAAPMRSKDGPAEATAGSIVNLGNGRLRVQWAAPVNNLNRRYDWTEVHVSTSSGFTPSSSTLQAVVRGTNTVVEGLTPGTDYYAKLIHRSNIGGLPTIGATTTVSAAGQPWFTTLDTAPYVFAELSLGTTLYGTSYQHVDVVDGAGGSYTTETDPFSLLDSATTELTVNATGWHNWKGFLDIGSPANSQCKVALYKNIASAWTQVQVGSYNYGGAFNFDFEATAGDEFRLYARLVSGTARGTAEGWFSYRLIQQNADI